MKQSAYIILATALSIINTTEAATNHFSCEHKKIVTVNLPYGGMPFTSGTLITNQLSESGTIFQDGALVQDNILFYTGTIAFKTKNDVISTSITIRDHNSNIQTHTLSAYDKNNNILDTATFTDSPQTQQFPQPNPDRFTITVSSCEGIAYVTQSTFPPGTEAIERIDYSTTKAN